MKDFDKNIFWNPELKFLDENKFDNYYFQEYFFHICNYASEEDIYRFFDANPKLKQKFLMVYDFIFRDKHKKRITSKHYEIWNWILQNNPYIQKKDEILSKETLYSHKIADVMEWAILERELQKNKHIGPKVDTIISRKDISHFCKIQNIQWNKRGLNIKWDLVEEEKRYGVAVEYCYGYSNKLYVWNYEYENEVNFCPFCWFSLDW